MTEEQEQAGAPGCGRRLRRTREQLGLSVDDIASELRLSGFQIQALEDDDWTQLPGTTYARGYLRSYARLLGLDADQLMAGASTQEIEISRKEPEISARRAGQPEAGAAAPETKGSGGASWGRVGAVVAAVLLALGYWQYREGWTLVPGAVDVGDTARQESAFESRVGQAASMSEAAQQPASAAAESSGPASPDTPTPEVPRKAVFEFSQRSWIDVRDASGERLLYRDFPPGRRIQVEGTPPFRVFLGNARAVQVEYMGNVVTPDVGSGRLHARFVLGAPSG